MFRILIEYYTKQNRFAGISVSFASCDDIDFGFRKNCKFS